MSQSEMHPSLKAYISSFLSPPFPKMFPRGGGYRDQDPILMRDFRLIQKYELDWKEIREAQETAFSGGNTSMKSAMDNFVEQLKEEHGFSDSF